MLCFKPNNIKALTQTSNSQNDEIVKVHLELDEYNYDFANKRPKGLDSSRWQT